MILETISTYVKAHERLVLAAIAAVVLWFSVGHIENIIAKHDNANLQQAQVVAQAQQSKDAALAVQVAQQSAQYQALAEKVTAQNTALEQMNVALSLALTKQQHTDATLPPTELVQRLNTLVPAANATVTPSGIALPEAGAVATVQQLELVPAQQQELVNAQQELKGTQSLLTGSQEQVTTLSSLVTGLQTQIVDNGKVCTAQVAVVKAEARKSKRRWFYAGVVVGFVGRQILKTYTGI